jgi:hypothetical protein
MPGIDVVRKTAQQVLAVPTITGMRDNWLWDRTQRVVRNVDYICRMREISKANLAIDRFCLIGAAYFSDSGFLHYADSEEITSRVVLADLNVMDLRDFSAQVVGDNFSGVLSDVKVEKICKIIIESSNKFAEMIEAKILSDARSLDDMGAVGIFNEFRRYIVHGKGATDAINSWQRKVDYRYWEARLKESFRFESVRKIANRRFHSAEFFMKQLSMENSGKDLEEVVMEMLDK